MASSGFCTLQIVTDNNRVQRTPRCPRRQRRAAYIHEGLVSVPVFVCRGAASSAGGHEVAITTTAAGVDASVYP